MSTKLKPEHHLRVHHRRQAPCLQLDQNNSKTLLYHLKTITKIKYWCSSLSHFSVGFMILSYLWVQYVLGYLVPHPVLNTHGHPKDKSRLTSQLPSQLKPSRLTSNFPVNYTQGPIKSCSGRTKGLPNLLQRLISKSNWWVSVDNNFLMVVTLQKHTHDLPFLQESQWILEVLVVQVVQVVLVCHRPQ